MRASSSPTRRGSKGFAASLAVAALLGSVTVAMPAAGSTPAGVEPGVTLEPAAAGVVSGTVQIAATGVEVIFGVVEFYSATEPYQLIAETVTDVSGELSFAGLEAGQYAVAFSSYDDADLPVREWLGGGDTWYESSLVSLSEGAPYDFGTVSLGPREIRTDIRLFGPDRFATAAEVATEVAAGDGDGTVFVVNGFDFPDALSAGAAARDSALLMVTRTSIPSATATALTAIQPDRIVVVGGTAVVSSSVFTALQGYAGEVVRIAGANRYETSRNVITSSDGLAGDVDFLILATGRNFPDALAAVPAAIVHNAAVLLVDGSASRLDSATVALVQTLGVEVYLIGGTGVLSSGIENQLVDTIGPTNVSRVAGADRFATSVEVALAFFNAADFAFIVNGFGFPDALAAGPLAGLVHSPVYLVRKECMPAIIDDDIIDVLANRVVTVGGTAVVSVAAQERTRC